MENKGKNKLLVVEINLTIIILMFLSQISLTIQQAYIRSKVLHSGKILIVNENEILIYNQNLDQLKQTIKHSQSISMDDDLKYIDISQFLDDDGNFLVFCKIKGKIYLISDKTNEENELLLETSSDLGNIELNSIPYKYLDSNHFIFICYIQNSKIYIDEIKIISNSTGYYLEKKMRYLIKNIVFLFIFHVK